MIKVITVIFFLHPGITVDGKDFLKIPVDRVETKLTCDELIHDYSEFVGDYVESSKYYRDFIVTCEVVE